VEISPKLSIWINVILAILTAVSTGALSLSGIVSPATATQIVAFAGVGATILNLIMHSYASSQPGPAAPPDPPVVLAAQKVADLPSNASTLTIASTKAAAEAAVTAHQP
jgi:hypothetical protein